MSSNFSKDIHLSKRFHQQYFYYHALQINLLIRDQRERSPHNQRGQLQTEQQRIHCKTCNFIVKTVYEQLLRKSTGRKTGLRHN